MSILIAVFVTGLVLGFLWHEDRSNLAQENADLRRDLAVVPHVMKAHGRVAHHSSDCWCRADRGPNDRTWVAEHHAGCAQCRGAWAVARGGAA